MLTAYPNNRLVFLAYYLAAAFVAFGHDHAVYGTDRRTQLEGLYYLASYEQMSN